MGSRREDLQQRLLATFRVEAAEHLQTIKANLLALERGVPHADEAALVEETFRAMHTLKGAARSVSLQEIEAQCQACEAMLSAVHTKKESLSPSVLESLYRAVAKVDQHLAGSSGRAVREPQAAIAKLDTPTPPEPLSHPPPTSHTPEVADGGQERRSSPTRETVRVVADKLDALLHQAEEFLIPKLASEERVRDLTAALGALERCRTAGADADTAARGRVTSSGRSAAVAELVSSLREIEKQVREALTHLNGDRHHLANLVDDLLDRARDLRSMPVARILDAFPGMVRDLAHQQGKDVAWDTHGADLEIDRKVLEAIKDPLMHLVRNAVDHGIERPEDRTTSGKQARGRIAVVVQPIEQGRVEIRIEDDGRGIDLERIREAAVRLHLLTADEARSLDGAQTLALVYRSGLSTSAMITQVSGHGLGMAIAKEAVERIEGAIEIATAQDRGTTICLRLPTTIATYRGILVRANDRRFLIPADATVRAVRWTPGELRTIEGRPVLEWNSQPLPFARLGPVLSLPSSGPSRVNGHEPCVIVKSGERCAAVGVDEIIGERQVLLKKLEPPLVRVRHVTGAALLGTGEAVLLLRPGDLVASIQSGVAAAPPAEESQPDPRQKVILIVDDSITTRTMEKSLLETAGYQTRVAVDGVDAWSLLKTEPVDLVLSDVDMPRMNGLDLTAKIRADSKIADIPVVLVTALESREDKERGIEVGANAYVVKSNFDQSNLLEIIRRFL
jgi:two-component system chemotaxis sensor kinase CheA